MIKPELLQVYEHQSIKIKEWVNGVLFTKQMWEALATYHERYKGKYYQLTYQGVQFKQYVGIIQIGHLCIEILPKIDQTVDSTATWQRVLIGMLQYCRLLKTETAGMGVVRLAPSTILNLFFYQFLEEVEKLVQQGLLRQYFPTEQNIAQLKGQLILPKHLRYNQGHPERFYTKQQVFGETHLFNQILLEALKVLQQLPLSSSLKKHLENVYHSFPTLPAYQWNERDFEILLQQPDYRPYQSTIELARLILLNFSADIRYGRHHLFALLFDMNILFEEYIFQQLRRQANQAIRMSRQRSVPFWRRRNIRPDIVLEKEGIRYILDTKWKVLSSNAPKPSIEDLKQMYIYCRYFKATKGVLIFPCTKNATATTAQPFLDEEKAISCQLLLVNVLDKKGNLRKEFGKELFKMFIC